MADVAELLAAAFTNPIVYFLVIFGFAILVAIILPIPIEIAFILPLQQCSLGLFTATLLAVSLGKGVGSWLVFFLGIKVEGAMKRWAARSKWFARLMAGLEKFVRLTGALGLYALLSIPFMSDTAVLYFYALFNEEGKAIDQRIFILSNFLAGVNRVALVYLFVSTVSCPLR